jgi:hypothetical protein
MGTLRPCTRWKKTDFGWLGGDLQRLLLMDNVTDRAIAPSRTNCSTSAPAGDCAAGDLRHLSRAYRSVRENLSYHAMVEIATSTVRAFTGSK